MENFISKESPLSKELGKHCDDSVTFCKKLINKNSLITDYSENLSPQNSTDDGHDDDDQKITPFQLVRTLKMKLQVNILVSVSIILLYYCTLLHS